MIEISKLIYCGQDLQPLIKQHAVLGSLIIHDHDGVIQRIYVFIQRCKLFFKINNFYTNEKIIDLIEKKINVLSSIQIEDHPDQDRIRQIQEVVKNSLDCFFVENTGHEKVCDQKLEKHIKNLHKSLQQILQEPVISLRPLKQSPNAQEPLEPLSYKEPQENNILQAKDTMTFPDPDGAIYEGDFVDGLRRGKGKYIFLDGAIYEGDFVGGLFQGKGKYIFTDGAIYEGDFVGGLRTGKGKYIWRSGAIYEGNFVNGSCTGKGKMIFLDGENYEGNFVNGLRSGRGKYIWRNGDTYEGNFVNGSCTGKGKYTFSDGAIYEGDFVDGWVQGKSKYTFFFRQVIWRLLGAPTSKRFLGRQ